MPTSLSPLKIAAFHATLLGSMLLTTPIARAACPDLSGSGGTDYDAEDCSINSTAVCSLSGSTWTCDVSADTASASVTAVTDFDSDNSTIEAWGDFDGEHFCCTVATSSVTDLVVEGSQYADALAFTYSSLTYNLKNGPLTALTGTINGNGGNDTIVGSNWGGADYLDDLHGGAGADTIHSHGGADELYGDAGNDTMLGGSGDDYMDGGDNEDTMLGQAGDDEMHGGDGVDGMSGGTENDNMEGGLGGDHICGDDGNDSVNDGDLATETNPDRLWETYFSVCADVSNPGTYWNTASTTGSCHLVPNPAQTVRPALCP